MADSSKDIQLRELKDMVAELKNLIKTLQETVDATNEREKSLTQERDNLKEELRLLRQKLFGTSSEKRPAPPKEQNLFNEAEKVKGLRHVLRDGTALIRCFLCLILRHILYESEESKD